MKFDLSAQKPMGTPLHRHFQSFWAPWHLFGYGLIGFGRFNCDEAADGNDHNISVCVDILLCGKLSDNIVVTMSRYR